MTDEQWEQVGYFLEAVQDRPAEGQASFLRENCSDPTVRREVVSLLQVEEGATGLFDQLVPSGGGAALGAFEDAESVQQSTDPLELEGAHVDRYRIDAFLGGGGMGVVYRAHDRRLDRPVALKFLLPHLVNHPEAVERFVREAKAAAALDHPNIATIHEIGGTEAGRRYIAMAYCDGETLKEKLRRNGAFPVEDVVEYATQIAEGLQAAHEAGIVHRDVKPANVMVTETGQVKLVDFGLARAVEQTQLTESGRRLGTAAYMSPEQAEGEDVGARTDVWALGVLLYEVLTGKRPFQRGRDTATLHAILHEAPVPVDEHRADVPDALQRIVGRCLQKAPSERYESVNALLADLSAFRSGEKALASRRKIPDRATSRNTNLGRRVWAQLQAHWGRLGAAVVLLVTLGVAAGWLIGLGGGSPDVKERSVAVLPLTYVGAADSTDYFSLGMTDELIARLSQIENLSVIARTSVMQYQGTEKTISDIAQELGVAHVVEGSVRKVGGKVRVQVQLIEAETGEHLWAEAYTRSFQGLLDLQMDLARKIARELKLTLLPETQRRIASVPKVDSVAYTLYLQARKLRYQETAKSLTSATRLLQRSISIDSTFAPAWAQLSFCALYTPTVGGELPNRIDGDSLSYVAARRALTLDSTSAEAHVAMGIVKYPDFPAAGVHFKKAVDLSPGLANANREYGLYFMRMGRFAVADRYLKKAARLNPASPVVYFSLGVNDLYWGRYTQAKKHLNTALTLQPDLSDARTLLGVVHIQQDRPGVGLRELRRAVEAESTPRTLATLGWAYAQTGSHDSTTAVLSRFQQEFAAAPTYEAVLYAALGNTGRALDRLEAADVLPANLKVLPFFEPLRGEPHFEDLLQTIGLHEASVQRTMKRLSPNAPGRTEGTPLAGST